MCTDLLTLTSEQAVFMEGGLENTSHQTSRTLGTTTAGVTMTTAEETDWMRQQMMSHQESCGAAMWETPSVTRGPSSHPCLPPQEGFQLKSR